jgi:hypothetical protein
MGVGSVLILVVIAEIHYSLINFIEKMDESMTIEY